MVGKSLGVWDMVGIKRWLGVLSNYGRHRPQSTKNASLLPPPCTILRRAALLQAAEEAVEKRNLGEPTPECDLQTPEIAFHQLATRRLEPQVIEKLAQCLARVLLELAGKGRSAQAAHLQHIFQPHLLTEMSDHMPKSP